MADLIIPSAGHMHFSSTGVGSVRFGEAVDMIPSSLTNLILTVSGSATMSFNGTDFIPLTDGTYQFTHPHVHKIYFGAGTWAGIGVSL